MARGRHGHGHGRAVAIALALCAALALAAVAVAQARGKGPRELPAAAAPPEDVAEVQKAEKSQPPAPPERGKGKGKVLPAAAKPPKDVAEAEAKQKVPAPPGQRTSAEALAEKIRGRPGGAERVDKAKKGEPPGQGAGPQSRSGWTDAWQGIAAINPLFARAAHAGETFTAVATPTVSASGQHQGLRSTSPYLSVVAYGAMLAYYTPSNTSFRLIPHSNSFLGSSATNPYVSATVNVPTAGWYIVNLNAYAYGNVQIRHYESGAVALLEDLAKQSSWADYPTLQYLAAGSHYFYFVLPAGGYVGRVSVDSYP